jgi:ABC-type uncharacterized transport system auxiliary subunit
MMSAKRIVLALLSAATLAACSAPAPLPDFRYYRLAPMSAVTPLPAPLLDRPLVVERFGADGVHGERPILYANDPDSLKISQYHYQLWNDPPPVLVQQRLLDRLLAARIAPTVTERASGRTLTYRLSGTVFRFERVLDEDRPVEVVLGLRLSLLADGADLPLLETREQIRVPVRGERVEDSAAALSLAIDQLVDGWLQKLKARQPAPAA